MEYPLLVVLDDLHSTPAGHYRRNVALESEHLEEHLRSPMTRRLSLGMRAASSEGFRLIGDAPQSEHRQRALVSAPARPERGQHRAVTVRRRCELCRCV